MHRPHEIVVIEERLAHTHKNQVDALFGWRNPLIPQHNRNLPHNLPRRKVAFESQQSGHTKLAIHGTPYLARNTYGGPIPTAGSSLLQFVARLCTVAGFALISFRHPNGFDRLSVGKTYQVADGAIAGGELFFHHGQADLEPAVLEQPSELPRQGRNVTQGRNPLPVQSFKQLLSPIIRL